MTRFIHTADWQLGTRFGSVSDQSKQETLRSARFQAIERLAAAARTHEVDFVLVAGDLFDSPTASKDVVSRALAAIGSIPAPVFAIPGNHDHGGPGSLWDQPHFVAERASLAPNFTLLTEPKPCLAGNAVILPCPLLRRHSHANPLAWISGAGRSGEDTPDDLTRIVLAHGTTQEFGAERDADDGSSSPNLIDLSILDTEALDYIALGDWHGTKKVGPKVWYSGALEPDRFPRNSEYESGQALLVEIAARGSLPVVTPIRTGGIAWHEFDHDFQGADARSVFEERLQELLGTRVHQDALRFTLSGALSLEDDAGLSDILERYEARTLRLEVRQRPGIQPSDSEIRDLAARPGDPLLATVASRLQADNADDPLAIEGLRQLFACVREFEKGGAAR